MDVRVWVIPLLLIVAVGGTAVWYWDWTGDPDRMAARRGHAAVQADDGTLPAREAPPPRMMLATPMPVSVTSDCGVTSDRAVPFDAPLDLGPALASPDGSYVAYRGLDGAHTGLWVGSASDPAHARAVTSIDAGAVLDFVWAADSEHVLYMVDTEADSLWEVRAVDAASGGDMLVFAQPNADARVVKVSPKFPTQVVIGVRASGHAYQDLYRVDLETGKRALLYKNDGYTGFVVDDDLNIRIGVSEGRNGYRILSNLREASVPAGAPGQEPS